MSADRDSQLHEVHAALDAAGVPYGDVRGAYDAVTRVRILARRAKLKHPTMLRPEWRSFTRRMLPLASHGYKCNGCEWVLRNPADLREHWSRGCFDSCPEDQSVKW
jgi:hypothetical protein